MFLYHNTTEPAVDTFPVALVTSIDQHSTSTQQGSQNWQPIIYYPQLVCSNTGTAGSAPTNPCPAYYNVGAWQNEIVAIEDSVGNGTNSYNPWPNSANAYGLHCSYLIGGTPTTSSCAYRLAQTYDTGTNYNFAGQNATLFACPNGLCILLTSDWNNTLGCTDGETTCLDPVSANNATTAGTPSNVAVYAAGTYATITVSNTMSHGMKVATSGFAAATFLNTLGHVYVYSATTTSLVTCIMPNSGAGVCTVGGIGNASYNAAETAGTISWPNCNSANLFGSACQRTDVFMVQLVPSSVPTPPAPVPILTWKISKETEYEKYLAISDYPRNIDARLGSIPFGQLNVDIKLDRRSDIQPIWLYGPNKRNILHTKLD
jgi:hypothetical protein